MATFRSTQALAPRTKAETPIRAASPGAESAPSREKIAERAYQIWQARGCPVGRDQEHWLEAERELKAR